MLDIIIYGIILYFIYAILFKKSLTEKHRESQNRLRELDRKIENTQEEFLDRFEKRTGTRDVEKYWDDYLDRTGRRIK